MHSRAKEAVPPKDKHPLNLSGRRRVLIELKAKRVLHKAALSGMTKMGLSDASPLRGVFEVDESFPTVQLPSAPRSIGALVSFEAAPEESTYVVRGTIPADTDEPELTADPDVVGIFSDPVIESRLVCPGDAAVGTDADVARLLGVPALKRAGLDGTGICVAVVDTGINLAHLRSKGRNPTFDAARSWTPAGVATAPGAHPVDHGTMCAYDVGIAAPNATLLDHAVLLTNVQGSTAMAGVLSDALRSYAQLRATVLGQGDRLIISNSWGMFDPAWDYPVGHPGNYSDNPRHPFNVMVASLESGGADIVFAAGNCGRACPDGRCRFGAAPPICGANSHPVVISVAGVDTRKRWVGYSSQGPGRLSKMKPDLSAYTHFAGSGVYPADGGTSAACPVLAGVIAALRTKGGAKTLDPMQMRARLFRTAEDLGARGFDYDFGWGVVNPRAFRAARRGGAKVKKRR